MPMNLMMNKKIDLKNKESRQYKTIRHQPYVRDPRNEYIKEQIMHLIQNNRGAITNKEIMRMIVPESGPGCGSCGRH